MRRKIRDLKRDLRKAGFSELKKRGKGSHGVWRHPLLGRYGVTMPGKGHDGDDAKDYQEDEVAEALRLARIAEQQQKQKGR